TTAIAARGTLYVTEYSGTDQLSPLAAALEAVGSSPAVDTGTVTTASANQLLFLGAASNRTIRRPRGYKARGRKFGSLAADVRAVAPGPYRATTTQRGTAWVTQLVAFRAAGSAPDTTKPSVPGGLRSSNVTATSATVSWSPSTDDTGIAGYHVFRDGAQIATTTLTQYTDPTLSPATAYAFTVSAFDGAGNESDQSAPLGVTTASGPPPSAYPLKVSANGRYLVDQNDVPFLLTGDSPQALTVNISEAEADAFFADRQAAGFNAVWVNLLCATYTGGRADASTYDGIIPFTTPGDLSTPNEAFFTRVDHMLNLAAHHGLTGFLDPAETGSFLSGLNAHC